MPTAPRDTAGAFNRIRWEIEWHPANGGRIRRLGISRRAILCAVSALALAGAAVAAGGLSGGLDRMRARDGLAAARHQNKIVHARQAALGEHARQLAERSDSSEKESNHSGVTSNPAQ